MTKVRTTLTIDPEVLRAVKVRAARLGKGTIAGYFFDIGSLSYWSYPTMYQPVAKGLSGN